ncbi:Glyoxylase or a related metal-dependent hydrolase, beta-lactamase superfamily II [Geosmithia morbida]|uniref:Glyoxylase or a related metal-dependent hydrolase, beta-lactamase superfamily II n=1 Tax=Geosmithia morbida TaxID=1094350 RepID=A0A9P4Z0P2_9HYPO|nr:Glyoxylase or a related metal-dependent hydrolase, beta-lactamase superfamily II [Geosmithia morbida]KAF4126546.1 Glyoxylase or a related metal-dependent hydrolase, beta-lactamase superfamily II [Geosmithia morbida]
MPIGIRIIETGNIRIRPSQMTQPPGNVLVRRLRFLSDRRWTEPIPIFAFVMTHSEGIFLFDLGETPRCVHPGYYPWWQIGHHCVSVDIKESQGLGSQLREQGINPKTDIKAAVMSHLHGDHAGGLPDVHGMTDIFVSQSHWDAFQSPIYATLEGANPAAWPEDFSPSILQPTGPAIGPWTFSYPVTKDQKILAVDTPGHVPGHISLIVIDDDVTYFLVGDAAYSLELLDSESIDGINCDPYVALESQRKIKEFCSCRNVVVLPSHEYDSVRRLEEKQVYRPSERSRG